MILETTVGLLVIALGIAVKKVVDTNKKLEKYSEFDSVMDKDRYIQNQEEKVKDLKKEVDFEVKKIKKLRTDFDLEMVNKEEDLKKELWKLRKSEEKNLTKVLEKIKEKHNQDLQKEKEQLLKKINSHHEKAKELRNEIENIKKSKANLEKNRDKIHGEINVIKASLKGLQEEQDLVEFGHYKPRYVFPESIQYKNKLDAVKTKQKNMIKNKIAAVCETEWTVSGSKAEGRKMTNQNLRIMLRSFNGECDAAISKVKYNNFDTMKNRIEKSFEMINKLNTANQCHLTRTYRNTKLDELILTHEYHEKLQEEKEEQKEIKARIKEEERMEREFQRSLEKAAKDKCAAEEALRKAKEQLSHAHGKQVDRLQEKMLELETKLKEAEEKNQRAISMAQQTRSGYVYIISNEGSFGDGVFKIGMTRRLEPMDRVKELSSAAVPFKYDVHAMVYSTDAPGLETSLHKVFTTRRVNKVNNRKEFFRVSLAEIERETKKLHGEFKLTKFAEAREYRETLSITKEENKGVA